MKSIENLKTVKVVISERGFGKNQARKEYHRRVEERNKSLLDKKDKLNEKEK